MSARESGAFRRAGLYLREQEPRLVLGRPPTGDHPELLGARPPRPPGRCCSFTPHRASEDRHHTHGASATSTDSHRAEPSATSRRRHDRFRLFSASDRSRGSPQASNHGGEPPPDLALAAQSTPRKEFRTKDRAVLLPRRSAQRPNRTLPEAGHRWDSPPRNRPGHPILGPTPSRSARTSDG